MSEIKIEERLGEVLENICLLLILFSLGAITVSIEVLKFTSNIAATVFLVLFGSTLLFVGTQHLRPRED